MNIYNDINKIICIQFNYKIIIFNTISRSEGNVQRLTLFNIILIYSTYFFTSTLSNLYSTLSNFISTYFNMHGRLKPPTLSKLYPNFVQL